MPAEAPEGNRHEALEASGTRREVERIKKQLECALRGPAWHGPSLMEILATVDAGLAPSRPLATAHSIWEIVLHLEIWFATAKEWISGHPVRFAPEEDWPPVREITTESWEQARLELDRSGRRFLDSLGRLDDLDLDRKVPGRDYDYYVLLHGVIQHALYHAGQIAILKKTRTFSRF